MEKVCEFCGQPGIDRGYFYACALCWEWIERQDAMERARIDARSSRLTAELRESGAFIISGKVRRVDPEIGITLAECTTRTGLVMRLDADVFDDFHEGRRNYDGMDLQPLMDATFIEIIGF